MTPKEKAKDLFERFYDITPNEAWFNPPIGSGSMNYSAKGYAKHSALIAIDEMIEIQNDFYGLVLTPKFRERCLERVEYLKQVKEEIEKL